MEVPVEGIGNIEYRIENRASLSSLISYSLPFILYSIFFILLFIPQRAQAVIRLGTANTTSINSGLVGYWPLDGSVTNWATGQTRDLSGYGNTGQLIGMSTSSSPVAGRIGQALNFTGIGAIGVDLGTPSNLDFTTGSFSFGAWVRVTKSAGQYDAPFWKGGASAGQAGYDIELGTGAWTAHVADGTQSAVVTFGNEMLGSWVHLFVVVDRGTQKMIAYVNGVAQNTADISSINSVSSASRHAIIGSNNYSTDPFNGKIDDVRVYNRALSAAEVKQLYNTGAAKAGHSDEKFMSNGLVGYWTFDGPATNWATGQTRDLSGNGNTGQLIGMSTTTAPVAGKIGQGLRFDGVDDSVNVAVSNFAYSDGTFSAWVKPSDDNDENLFMANGDNFFSIELGGNASALTNEIITVFTPVGTMGYTTANRTELFDGKWHHVAVTTDTKTHIYLDGVERTLAMEWGSDNGTFIPAAYNVSVLRFGRHTSDTNELNGLIDDVRIYDRRLSAGEIKQLYNAGR